ncbi:MAG: long-chain fatty acid--CoA ligase [Rhodospirillaceae bacterium]|nr:long-chain fatty acid--CoA ligase [Rhodospirillaceae bacterium]
MGVTAMLKRTVQTRSKDTATVFGNRRQTWAQLYERVQRLAGGLRSRGLGPGDRIALIMNNCDRYLETSLATAWAGGVVTPLNGRWSVPELADAIEDSTPTVLMVDDSNLAPGQELVALVKKKGINLHLIYSGEAEGPKGVEFYEEIIKTSAPVEDAGRMDDDLFTIFYTGGTTGRSKGVMLSHGNIVSCVLQSMAEGHFLETAVYFNMLPTFHLSSMWPYMATTCSGAKNIIQPGFVPEDVLAMIDKEKVTEALLVPTMVQMLIEHPNFAKYNTSTFKRIIYGAAPITEALLDRAVKAFPSAEFVQAYGMTELAPLATTLQFRYLQGEHRKVGRNRSVGRPTFGVELQIVDENDKEVARGTVGEIKVRGPNRMLGYWNRKEETAAAIVDGWMHTGDGGYMDEQGFVYMVDRIKDMIISGGENIYSVEVENCVTQHPAVSQCAVIGVPDEKWGERVHAFIILQPGGKVTQDEIIAFTRERIAHYKCPRSVEFRTAFPLSGAGKVLKRELRKEFTGK